MAQAESLLADAAHRLMALIALRPAQR